MIEIAKTPFYSIRVDKPKNRVHLKLVGVWDNLDDLSGYLQHVKGYLREVEPGFSVITDIRELRECAISLQEILLQAQKLNLAAGIHQLAEIHKLNDPVSELAISLASESQIPLNIFENEADAEAWLEDPS